MRFLITNDDGFDAPGLAALYAGLSVLGEVDVVAPSVCHSSKGHAVNTSEGIRVDHRVVEPFGRIHVAHASPADCIRLGLRGLELDEPDFVVAGINPGANLGVDLYYSGTVAAAREAAILGVPALAVSRYTSPDVGIHWENLSMHASRIVATLTSGEFLLPGGQFWNVNFPSVPDDRQPAELSVVPMGLLSHAVEFKTTETTDTSTVLQYSSDFRRRGKSGSCDVSCVLGGQITATPVDLCNTARHPSLQFVETV